MNKYIKSLVILFFIFIGIAVANYRPISGVDYFPIFNCSLNEILVKGVCCDRASTCLRNADCPPCKGEVAVCLKSDYLQIFCPRCDCMSTGGYTKDVIGAEECTIESQCMSDWNCGGLQWWKCLRCKCVNVPLYARKE